MRKPPNDISPAAKDAMTAIRDMFRWGVALVAAVSLGASIACVAKAEERVDVELVLLADVSQSMDLPELQMQRAAYVAALRDPMVMHAIRAGSHGKIVLSFVEFDTKQNLILPPTYIRTDIDLAGAATAVERAPLVADRGMTAIGDALLFARGLFTGVGDRLVIDVSGDGEVNSGIPIAAVDLTGIQVNGLPIGPIEIARYYDAHVVRDGFLIPVERVEDMAIALRTKLLREIADADGPVKVGGAR